MLQNKVSVGKKMGIIECCLTLKQFVIFTTLERKCHCRDNLLASGLFTIGHNNIYQYQTSVSLFWQRVTLWIDWRIGGNLGRRQEETLGSLNNTFHRPEDFSVLPQQLQWTVVSSFPHLPLSFSYNFFFILFYFFH